MAQRRCNFEGERFRHIVFNGGYAVCDFGKLDDSLGFWFHPAITFETQEKALNYIRKIQQIKAVK